MAHGNVVKLISQWLLEKSGTNSKETIAFPRFNKELSVMHLLAIPTFFYLICKKHPTNKLLFKLYVSQRQKPEPLNKNVLYVSFIFYNIPVVC